MSVKALVSCWGPQFPSANPVVRLVALAIADCVAPDNGNDVIVISEDMYEWLAERTGQSHAMVQGAISDLAGLGVMDHIGTNRDGDAVLRWDFTNRWAMVES